MSISFTKDDKGPLKFRVYGKDPAQQIVIEAIEKCNSNLEHFIAQYLARTGHPIEECVLFQQADVQNSGCIKFWIELKDE